MKFEIRRESFLRQLRDLANDILDYAEQLELENEDLKEQLMDAQGLDPSMLVRGDVKVEFDGIGEGFSGEYDPNDPADKRLLRFYVSKKIDGEWVDVDDASYCTRMPEDTDPHILLRALIYLMDCFYDAVVAGDSVKKQGEELSWIDPSWFGEGKIDDKHRS